MNIKKILAVVPLLLGLGIVLGTKVKNSYLQPKNEPNTTSVATESAGQINQVLPTEPSRAPMRPSRGLVKAKVVWVIDGDTIKLETGETVRYIGMDTPEMDDPDVTVLCFAKESWQANKNLAAGKTVWLEKDQSETDRFGRLLRYVWLGDILLNDWLVRQGYAYSTAFPPDIKYQDFFQQAQAEAQANSRGLWENLCR